MGLAIVWDKEARDCLLYQVKYLETYTSLRTQEVFFDALEEVIKNLSEFAYHGRKIEGYLNIRRVVFEDEYILYHAPLISEIRIVGFWNTNWDPKDNPFE